MSPKPYPYLASKDAPRINDPFMALACLVEAAKSHQKTAQALRERPPVTITEADIETSEDPRA